jgi:hypothetical protein
MRVNRVRRQAGQVFVGAGGAVVVVVVAVHEQVSGVVWLSAPAPPSPGVTVATTEKAPMGVAGTATVIAASTVLPAAMVPKVHWYFPEPMLLHVDDATFPGAGTAITSVRPVEAMPPRLTTE